MICYHNFKTNEKILEYDMEDTKLREILISNLYGESETATLQKYEGKPEKFLFMRHNLWCELLYLFVLSNRFICANVSVLISIIFEMILLKLQ